MVRALIALAAALALAAPAGAQGLDHVASEGVELVKNDRSAGSGQGVAVVGNKLLTYGPSNLNLYDIADPANPVLKGTATLQAANEGEDVVTNGKIAAIASAACTGAPNGCVEIFDVSGYAVVRLATVPVAAQIPTCVMDCRYLWVTGPDSAIIDLADPAAPKVVGSFLEGVDQNIDFPCFQAREVRPGLVLLACEPVLLMSALPEHGGSPTKPVLIATGTPPQFDFTPAGAPHSTHWPRAGADRFLLTSTETAFHPQCEQDIGAFVTWDARPVAALAPGSNFTKIDQWRPQNGTYADGRSPYNAVGCSAHFLDEHPAFRDGGLVAVTALENGLRLLQVTAEGKIEERGWFLGAGGTAAVAAWHPDGKHLYLADYARGLDVLRYTGDTFVPPAAPAEPGATPGPPVAPGRRFRVAGVRLDRRRGRATLAIEAPSAGRIDVAPKAGRQALRRVTVKVSQAGLVRVTIGATGRARRTLVRRGRLVVSVHLTFTDARGAARFARTRVTLRRKR